MATASMEELLLQYTTLRMQQHELLGSAYESVCIQQELLFCFYSLMTQWFFTRGVTEQTRSFLEGFNEVVPLQWLQYFDERELEVKFLEY